MSSSGPAPDGRSLPEVDFRIDDLDADEQLCDDFHRQVSVTQDMFVRLAEHHTADGVHSYHVLFDGSATWGIPGAPQVMAVVLRRDPENKSFSFEQVRLPLPAMAQSWLIHRGCPPGTLDLDPEAGPPAADEMTRALERRLAGSGDHYAMGYSYTRDDPDDMVTVVALRALDERTPTPFRVLVEEVDLDAWTHTLREGGFATKEEALRWCDDRIAGEAAPLPPVRPAATFAQPTGLPTAPAAHPPGRSR
ncbi:hypothetical protein [Streptomyces sp. CC208A]|uniref:hypothetical protein n=1 Tax=Streptomyces sp. CC208A TaxID=3044573 RepID=UPI0024A8555D|nr:hypothetical protein [Streptomyces sp. CC208A]